MNMKKDYAYDGRKWAVAETHDRVNGDRELTLQDGTEFCVIILHRNGHITEQYRWNDNCAECKFG